MKILQRLKIDSLIRALIYSLIVVMPLLFWPDFHSVFTLPKLTFFRVVSLLILFLWMGKFYLSGKIIFKKSFIYWPLLLIAFTSIVTTLFSINLFSSLMGQQGRFIGLFTIFNLLLLPIFIVNFIRKKDLSRILQLSILTASLSALYGILQYYNLIVFTDLSWSEAPSERLFGTIGHGAQFGAYLAMHIGLAFCLLFKNKKVSGNNFIVEKILLMLAIFIQAYALVLTASRGPLIALLLSLVIGIGLLIWNNIRFIKKYLSRLLLIILVFIIITVSFCALNWNRIINSNLVQRTNFTLENWQKGVIPDRFSWIFSSIDIFKSKPFFGSGLSTFRDIYSQFRRKDYVVVGPGDIQYITIPEAAHNEVFNLLATQGLLGIFTYLFLVVTLLIYSVKLLKNNRGNSDFISVVAVLSVLLIYFFQSLFSFGIVITLFILYLFIGLLTVFEPNKSLKLDFRGLKKNFISSLALIVIFSGFYGTIAEAKADLYFKRANFYEAVGDNKNVENSLKNALQSKPWEYSYYQAFADFALKSALAAQSLEQKIIYLDKAIEHYEQALKFNHFYPSTYHNLGVAYLQRYSTRKNDQDLKSALFHFEFSTIIAPNNALYLYQTAKIYIDLSQPVQAKKMLEQILEIQPEYRDVRILLDDLSKSHQLKN